MEAKELIELLQKLPPDTLVVVHIPSEYENGNDRFRPLEKLQTGNYVHGWVSGNFSPADSNVDAVVLYPIE